MLLKVLQPIFYLFRVFILVKQSACQWWLLTALILKLTDKLGWLIVVKHHVREKLSLIFFFIVTLMKFELRLPLPFQVMGCFSTRLLPLINPTKEHRFEPHLGHQTSNYSRMSKWVKLPPIFWSQIKFLLQEVVTGLKVHQYVSIVSSSFIWWD